MRFHPIAHALPLILLLCAYAHARQDDTETPPVFVPMQDGTKLAMNVYLPEGDGPWPVLLLRSTYGREHGQNMTKQGYAVVTQDVRGMGQSEGEKHVFYSDGWRPGLNDGADTVTWILAQPWCNGKIGTGGESALAMTEMLLAPTTNKVLAQFAEAVPSNFYYDVVYQGGVYRQALVDRWLFAIRQPRIILFYRDKPYYDDYWKYYNVVDMAPKITSPALFVNGWYDIFQQGTINAFLSREQNGGPGAKGNNYLVMDWSTHGGDSTPDYTFNDNRFDLKISDLRDRFLACHLKDDVHALDGVAKVHFYVMGDDTPGAPGSEWRTAETWPPYPTTPTAYYTNAGGLLSTESAADAAALEYTYDPQNPYPTKGGQNLLEAAGPYDQREFSTTRTDLLKFATAPLDAPLEIVGRVTVRLNVSTDAPDTDFTAKLVDIFPAGDDRELLMLDGIRRVKMRHSCEKPEPLLTNPDEVIALDVDLQSTAWVFNKGHRIGLHISSSNAPRFEPNPNTGADHLVKDGETRIAHNKIHFGGAYATCIELPVHPVDTVK